MIGSGNTVIAIEHNKQFTMHCDWRIELGAGAGQEGGNVIRLGINRSANYDICDLCIKVTLNGIHYQGMCLMA